MEIKLGDVVLNKPVILAPLDGYTDIPYRLIVKEMQADLIYTEFVNSDAIIYTNRKTMSKMKILEEERPVVVQIFGSKPENMAKAAQIVEQLGPEIIDINFGCPSPSVSGHGSGAALLKDLPLLEKICESVVKAVKIPVTAKTRIGWDSDSINILETGKRIEGAGIKTLTLHPRTRNQKFKGLSDWSYIKLLKENISIPVIGNGDIKSPEDGLRMFDETGCDGIMIGREGVKNPWIFKQTKDFLATGKYEAEISLKERIRICLKHFDLAVEYKEPLRAQFEMRKLYQNYFRGLNNFKRFKKLVFGTTDVVYIRKCIEDVETIINDTKIDQLEMRPAVKWE